MRIPTIDEWLLKQTANILDEVLNDGQLTALCAKCRLEEKDGGSKRERIFCTLVTRQKQDGYSHNVVSFIRACMNPVRFRGNQRQFAKSRCRLNDVLAYAGLQVREDGKVWVVQTEQSKEMAEIRRSAVEAVHRLCGDEVEARLWKKLMRDKSYGTERFEAAVLINRFRQTSRPALNDENVKRVILSAAERQDQTFFKRLGKALSAKPKLRVSRILSWQMMLLPPLVTFLLTRWTCGCDGLPPLCFLTPTSLTDVCGHYMGSEFSDMQITKLRQRLGLKQHKRHQVEVIDIDGQLKVL